MLPALTCVLLAQLAAAPLLQPAARQGAPAGAPTVRVIHLRPVGPPRGAAPELVCHIRVHTADPALDPGLVQSGEPVFDRHMALDSGCRPTSVEPGAKRK